MVTARLVFRLVRGGGRRGRVRLVLMVVGVAVTVATVLIAGAYPAIVQARAQRAADRMAL